MIGSSPNRGRRSGGWSVLVASVVASASMVGGYGLVTVATSQPTPSTESSRSESSGSAESTGSTSEDAGRNGLVDDGSQWAAEACGRHQAELVRREEGDLIDWDALEAADDLIDPDEVDESTVELVRPPVDGRVATAGERPEPVRFGPAPEPSTIGDLDLLAAVESCELAGLLIESEDPAEP